MKNYESTNSIPDLTIENQWGDLEKIGEEGFHCKKESANSSEQKSPEQKETELQLSAAKVRESFASRTETPIEQSTPKIHNIEVTPVIPTLTPVNIIRKFLLDRQIKKIERVANVEEAINGRSKIKDKQKVISLVENKKVDLANPRIANSYIKIKLSQPEKIIDKSGQSRFKTVLEKIEDMVSIGIEPREPATLIAENIITEINDSQNKENTNYYDRQFAIDPHKFELTGEKAISLAKMSEIIEKYNIPEVCDTIRQNIDVQSFGDKAINYALNNSCYRVETEKESAITTKQIEQSKRGIDLLRKIGYKPFKDGVEPLFSDTYSTKNNIKKQNIAKKLSLIDEDIVDSMYQYKFRTLNDNISNYEDSRDMSISEDLRCSGKDAFALFWEQRTQETGEDELNILAKKAKEHYSGSIITEMARDYSESDDQKNNPLTFFLNNPNLLSGPDRGFLICLNSAIAEASNNLQLAEGSSHKDGVEQNKRGFVKEAVSSVLRFQRKNKDGYRLLFNENGVSDVAKEISFFDSDYQDVVQKIDSAWYSDIQGFINSHQKKSYILEHPDLLNQLTPRRRSLAELTVKYPDSGILRSLMNDNITQYFDENGNLTPKLAENLLSSNYNSIYVKEFLRSCPEIYTTLSSLQQSYLDTVLKTSTQNRVLSLSNQEIEQYFDENGPKPEFWQFEFSQGNFDGIINYLEKTATPDENGKTNYNYGELGLPKVQESAIRFCSNAKWFIQDLNNLIISDKFEQYFDENGPKQEFWQFEFSQGNLDGIKNYLNKTAASGECEKTNYNCDELGLSKIQESVLHFHDNAKWFIHDLNYFIKSNELEKYFDENGPKQEFWQFEFSKGDFDGIIRYARPKSNDNSLATDSPLGYIRRIRYQDDIDYTPFGLSINQTEALRVYSSLKDNVARNDFRLFISNSYDEISISRIKSAHQILDRLGLSNSSEITTHRSAFAKQLLKVDLDNDEKMFDSLERIEDVFIHNNLPFVGKAFLSFQILHPSASLDSDFDFSKFSSISPSLKELPNNAAQANSISGKAKNRETVIFSDLLKASFKSNNRSIREYLENLRVGQDLINKLSSGEISWDRFKQLENDDTSGDAKNERDVLNIFVQHLNTMYNNTDSGKKSPSKLTGDLEQDLMILVGAFSPTERHKLSDRIVRSFAFFAGIRDFNSAKTLLDSTAENATSRNKDAAKNGLRLERGDLVKGIGRVRYLPNILQNGSVAKEFLGDSAGSDATPLDTDLSIILENRDSISAGLGATEANGYGPVWLVLKGDENRPGEGRFSITRRAPEEQNQQVDAPDINGKLEAFYTGVIGRSHYGIRTGFGSSEIDYFISSSDDINGTPTSKIIGLETALNGFYIPVLDKMSGDIVFSPEEYDEIREKMSGLNYYGTGEYHFAKDSDLTFNSISFNNSQVDSIEQIISQLPQNEAEVRKKHSAIDTVIDLALDDIGGLKRKNRIDGDLTEGVVELIDTGSTGRFDNAPGSGDFDYMMRVDKSITSNPQKLTEISNALLARFNKTEHDASEVLGNGNLRLKGVRIDGLEEPVDIDISFIQKTDKTQYSTDMALMDRLKTIKRQSPEKHQQIVANIIFAKKFLKLANAYKPNRGETPQGGLGGVGIENWILQNGGSFLSASKDFMAVAEQCSSFDEFRSRYTIWDFGENHMANGEKQHDNFVADNMSAAGYEKMKEALTFFLKQQI